MFIFSVFLTLDRLSSLTVGYVKRDSNYHTINFAIRKKSCGKKIKEKSIFCYLKRKRLFDLFKNIENIIPFS